MPPSVSLFDVEPILDTLQARSLVITSNQRLATRISNAYVMACASGAVVETPRVYSLTNWIDRQWQALLAGAFAPALERRLLEPHQELHLWETIVADTPLGQALLRPQATAAHAAAAYRLMVEWQLDPLDESVQSYFSSSEDGQTWLHWARQFDHCCEARQLLAPARMVELLIQGYRQGYLEAESDICLVGFLDQPPLYQTLLDVAGEVRVYQPPQSAAAINRVHCDSSVREWQAAAVWAKQVLKNDPAATVAIVVPDLNQNRATIERIVMQVFEPGYNMLHPGAQDQPAGDGTVPGLANTAARGQERRALPFNISAGSALIESALVRTALDLLSLLRAEVELESIESLLQSPFIAIAPDEINYACNLARRCRQQRSFTINSSQLRQWALASAPQETPWPFAVALQQLANTARQQQLQTARPHSQWAQWFEQILDLFGWPGQRSLDSIEYQQVQQWTRVLQQFSSLDAATGSAAIGFSQALAQLTGLLSKHIFQPQTADSPLQVLGVLEAAGLQFSHLWLTSMSSRHWPPAASPNPLLPLALQTRYSMPHCNAQRELGYTEKLTRQLLAAAQRVMVSAPRTVDDNPAQFSRLFDDYPVLSLQEVLGRELDTLLPVREIRRRHLESGCSERVSAGNAPPLAEGDKVSGGVAIFSDQSACPFRAYARHRLHIDALEQPQVGLSAADRGSMLHRALELFWNSVGSQQQLRGLSEQERLQRCEQSSQYAVDQYVGRSGLLPAGRLQQMEQERLRDLLFAWSERELERADFTVIATEQRRHFVFAGLECDARIDRIDRLQDDSLVIIDYKSGSASPVTWWGERPEQPQLPLYAKVVEKSVPVQSVGAIAFAQVSVRDMAFRGVGAEDSPEPAVRWDVRQKNDSGHYTWDQQKQEWESVLATIADGFLRGDAAVDPKYHPRQNNRTCRYCQLQAVCRIEEGAGDE